MQLLTAGRGRIVELAFAPDGSALVASVSSCAPVMWSLPAVGVPVLLGSQSAYTATHFTFSADGNTLGWLRSGKRVEYDRRSGESREVSPVPAGEHLNGQVVCGPSERLIVRTVQTGQAGAFRIRGFSPDGSGGWAEAWTIGPADEYRGWGLAAPAADRFFVWEGRPWRDDSPKRLAVRSALSGEVLASAEVRDDFIARLTCPPDGGAVVGFKDSWLCVWRPGEKVERVRTGTLKHYRSLAFHPAGRLLLAGNNDTTARLIDTESWQVVRQFTWNVGSLTAVAVSPDGTLAAAGGEKGRVVVWDLDV